MSIVYTDETALEFWRWHARTQSPFPTAEGARPYRLGTDNPSPFELHEECARFHCGGSPIHVLVSEAKQVRLGPDIAFHVHANPLPSRSCLRISSSASVVSPAFLFLRMATRLDRIALAQLGFELCGTYTRTPEDFDMRGFCHTEPLTTVREIGRFIAACQGERGIKRARSTLKLISEGAASPRETATAMLLSLPPRMGGYGIERPALNARIELSQAQQAEIGRLFVKVDMLWRAAKLVLEYDSDEWHGSKERLNYDSQRRNLLRSIGYDVITLTNSEAKSLAKMGRVAKCILKALGQRVRAGISDYDRRKWELHQRLILQSDPDSFL